ISAAEFGRRCRVSFVKVAEFQRRGVVHFHALIRLDNPGEDYQPPQIGIDATGLAEAIRQATAHVRLTVEIPGGADLVLRFGEQLDTQTVNGGPTGELTPEHAARYIAKYATKSSEHFGLGERRITPEALPQLDVTTHVNRLVHTAWQLGEHPDYQGLHRWIHMIGFRGHFASKSRRYSTTLGAIRGERRAYRQHQAAERVSELVGEDTTIVVAHWEFAGVGYLTAGDTALALSAAARAREQRRAARDAA
ncbi:MAG: replication initiator, partial [Sciscionella sp.]